MRKLIKSSVFKEEIGEILIEDINQEDEMLKVSHDKSSKIIYEIHVQFSRTANPGCSIIKVFSAAFWNKD